MDTNTKLFDEVAVPTTPNEATTFLEIVKREGVETDAPEVVREFMMVATPALFASRDPWDIPAAVARAALATLHDASLSFIHDARWWNAYERANEILKRERRFSRGNGSAPVVYRCTIPIPTIAARVNDRILDFGVKPLQLHRELPGIPLQQLTASGLLELEGEA